MSDSAPGTELFDRFTGLRPLIRLMHPDLDVSRPGEGSSGLVAEFDSMI